MAEWFKAQHWKCCLDNSSNEGSNPSLSARPRKASLVQLVEHWSPKPGVEGSSPSGRALFPKKVFSKLQEFVLYLIIS